MNLTPQELLDCIDIGFIATDQRDRVTYLNPTAMKAFGIPADGKSWDFALFVSECPASGLEQWCLIELQLILDGDGDMPRQAIAPVHPASRAYGPMLARICQGKEASIAGNLYCLPYPSPPTTTPASTPTETRRLVHDACQPLTAISNFAMGLILAHQAGTLQPELLTATLESIQKEAIRASKLVKTIAGHKPSSTTT